MTAYNPHGQRAQEASNLRADRALQGWLAERRVPARPVVNGEGEWAEPAWLLRGLTLAATIRLGRQFQQAAVLWGQGQRVALVDLSPLRVRRFWLALERPD